MRPDQANRLLQLKRYFASIRAYISRLHLDTEYESQMRDLLDLWTLTVDNSPLYNEKELDDIIQGLEQATKDLVTKIKLEVS